MNFAHSWGYGGVCIANLFAFRASAPQDMMAAADPVGRRNNYWLRRLAYESDLVVAAWGNEGGYHGRAAQVLSLIPQLHCLKMNNSGQPAHPLYQPASAVPLPMST